MALMCCCGRILHPISADLLLPCGALMAAVGGRWLALISFVSLIMRLSQGLSGEACLNPCAALLSWVSLAPPALRGRERERESSLTCREVRNVRLQGRKVGHESSLKDDTALGHIYGLAVRYLLLSHGELPVTCQSWSQFDRDKLFRK